ncbi:MAG: bifunctional adenosylcobinamide kinase/adenosylcobinamide-phosphate guanylyltransferase [Dehalococcoidia bacterium]|nr:bifunctional adenosylcobinamide kinase/adenosylcobinamide-phosphate guanylyltransferase [Dehalococcoidia bacterium]
MATRKEYVSKRMRIILGGVRSGKSALGEQLARPVERALFVATAEPLAAEMKLRIANHLGQRPGAWKTLEEPTGLAAAIPN